MYFIYDHNITYIFTAIFYISSSIFIFLKQFFPSFKMFNISSSRLNWIYYFCNVHFCEKGQKWLMSFFSLCSLGHWPSLVLQTCMMRIVSCKAKGRKDKDISARLSQESGPSEGRTAFFSSVPESIAVNYRRKWEEMGKWTQPK